MKTLLNVIAAGAILVSIASAAVAQPDGRGYDHRGGQHPGWGQDHNDGSGWRRGRRMGYEDWNNAPRVDYRRHHLRAPPRGYEWREANGRYVLAAVATGVIASIILNAGH